jgi:hypothetical protein
MQTSGPIINKDLDLTDVTDLPSLKSFLMGKLDIYKNKTTSQVTKSQIMKSINLLLKSDDIKNRLDVDSIDEVYGKLTPFISEQKLESKKVNDPNTQDSLDAQSKRDKDAISSNLIRSI